jgi:hypothetical protein
MTQKKIRQKWPHLHSKEFVFMHDYICESASNKAGFSKPGFDPIYSLLGQESGMDHLNNRSKLLDFSD